MERVIKDLDFYLDELEDKMVKLEADLDYLQAECNDMLSRKEYDSEKDSFQ
ncbi:hypothetical protein ACFOGI_10680 [Virgibacillus xinjiangensis]|uniref:Uncharacterized protein n=1 Tax=Virgibacillus xinjiangensis TaxID=393090 RepID=A0ABV7CX86_9BACI